MERILITGGAGFIGSHVVHRVADVFPDAKIDVLDKMTYAADAENISSVLKRGQRRLHVGDVCDYALCFELTQRADCVIHLAAESHVDNSFGNSLRFSQSNMLGTHTLLEASRANKVPKFIHVSTDEVYGETLSGVHTETDPLNPTNPYSASKAGADMVANAYIHSFGMPIVILRANNIFGIRQYPEKIIPRFTMLALSGEKFTIHGNGANRRRYLAAPDFANGVVAAIRNGIPGEIYNVASDEEYRNVDVRDMIAEYLGIDGEANTLYVSDRPFNDARYAVNPGKLEALGWERTRTLRDELPAIIEWYRANMDRYEHLFQRSS